MLLFLLGSGISLAYLTLLFYPVEAPEETIHGCSLLTTVGGDPSPRPLRITSLLLSHHRPMSREQCGPWALLSICSLRPACQGLDKMGNCPANQCLPMQTI